MIARATISAVVVLTLAACASPQEQRARQQQRAATEFLARQGSIGDPGRVAAADFAFAKMAREEGNWTAFRAYAAPGARMDAPGGFAPVSELLAGVEDPPEPIRWEPTNVWSSCDGRLAVTQGRFLRPNGLVGDYVSVWELQPDNTYKYIYDTGTPDDPQPAPPVPQDLPEDAIVVPGLTAIEGRVADCNSAGHPGYSVASQGGTFLDGMAADRTLYWHSDLRADGSRQVEVAYLRGGEWETVVVMPIPAPPAQQ